MIWLTTILMLVIVVHLWRNAAAERRLYLDSLDDPAKAYDEGLFANATGYFSDRQGDGAAGIASDNSRFGRAVARVQQTSERVGKRIDQRTSEARERGDDETFFGRSVNRVRESGDKLGRKLDQRLEAARTHGADESGSERSADDSMLGRVSRSVIGAEDKLAARMKRKAERLHDEASGPLAEDGSVMGKMVGRVQTRMNAEEDGFFDRMVGRVSGKLASIDSKIDDKMKKARGSDGGEDMLSRTAARIGPSIDAADERMIDGLRKGGD